MQSQCTICGRAGHRASRCPLRLALVAVAVVLTGCAVAVPADTLCQLPRPRAALNDTKDTRASQAAAGKIWDQRCTLVGLWK